MGFLKKNPPRTKVEVIQSTHGQTYVTYPTDVASDPQRPALPLGHAHPQSRQWLLADKTVVLILPGDPSVYPGGVIRHTFDVVMSSWNNRTKMLSSMCVHPSNSEVTFVISTNGIGCACTQGAPGNAGPIGEPYEIAMVKPNTPEFDWYQVMTP